MRPYISRETIISLSLQASAKFLISSSVDVLLKSILRDPSGTSWNFLGQCGAARRRFPLQAS